MKQNTQIKYSELKKKLSEIQHPKQIRLNGAEFIFDTDKFLKSHYNVLDANSGRKIALPYYNRLVKYYKLLKKNEK